MSARPTTAERALRKRLRQAGSMGLQAMSPTAALQPGGFHLSGSRTWVGRTGSPNRLISRDDQGCEGKHRRVSAHTGLRNRLVWALQSRRILGGRTLGRLKAFQEPMEMPSAIITLTPPTQRSRMVVRHEFNHSGSCSHHLSTPFE